MLLYVIYIHQLCMHFPPNVTLYETGETIIMQLYN